MANLLEIPARSASGDVHVVVESPRGSRVKLKYEPELGAFTISRPLILGFTYPFDWGFVPSTRAEDGDPLDAMVLLDAPTFPGVVIPVKALGVLRVTQKGKEGGRVRNDRIFTAPASAARLDAINDMTALPERIREEMEQFFVSVVALADKEIKLEGWGGPEEAEALVDALWRR